MTEKKKTPAKQTTKKRPETKSQQQKKPKAKSQQQKTPQKGPKNKVLRGVIAYLKDWRNWLVHGLVGVGLLLLAIFAPIELWVKVVIFACVIIFNCIRMGLGKKKK